MSVMGLPWLAGTPDVFRVPSIRRAVRHRLPAGQGCNTSGQAVT